MSTVRALIRAGVAAVILVGLSSANAAAQMSGRIVLTPYAAAYVPSNDLVKASAVGGGLSVVGNAKHQAGFAYGLNGSYWLNDRTAIELGGAYAFSDVKGSLLTSDVGGVTSGSSSENAHVIFGSAKVMFHLLPPDSKFNLRLGVGPAIISRGGTAYKSDAEGKVTGLTDVGAAMSLCSRIPLAKDVGIRLRAENYLYQAKLKFVDKLDPSGSFAFDSRIQNDFIFSAGVQLFLNK
jgi:outer membrane protein W